MASNSLDGERNPIIRWVIDSTPRLPGGLNEGLVGVAFVLVKLGLLLFLVRIANRLGRYRLPVLAIAIVVGIAGTMANLHLV